MRTLPDWLGLSVFAYRDASAVFAERRHDANDSSGSRAQPPR